MRVRSLNAAMKSKSVLSALVVTFTLSELVDQNKRSELGDQVFGVQIEIFFFSINNLHFDRIIIGVGLSLSLSSGKNNYSTSFAK